MVQLTGKTPLSLDDLCVPDKKQGVMKASAGPARCKSTQFLAPGPTTPLGDSVSSGSGKAFPGRVSASHVLYGSMSAKTSPSGGGASVCFWALSCHLPPVSEPPDVTYLLTFFTVDWSVLLGKPQFVVLKNSSQSTWTASSPGPEQEATFSLSDCPQPCPSRERGWRAGSFSTLGMAQTVSLCRLLPQHKSGTLSRPCQVFTLESCWAAWMETPAEQGQFWGEGRRCFNENADTTLKYSGALPGAAIIKKGTD